MMMRLSFKTQFKIEFLLPFTGSRKVLGKMITLKQMERLENFSHESNLYIIFCCIHLSLFHTGEADADASITDVRN